MQTDWIQNFILVLTFLVLYFYTAETAALRREAVRQTRVTLRPIVVPIFARETRAQAGSFVFKTSDREVLLISG
jgi:hypothetical protein